MKVTVAIMMSNGEKLRKLKQEGQLYTSLFIYLFRRGMCHKYDNRKKYVGKL